MRYMMWLLLAIAGASAAQDYPTPSFDCANAETQVERRICTVQALAELDGKHGRLAELVIRTAPDREKARGDVESWIRNVRDECQDDGCLERAYTARNAELERIVAKQPPLKALPAWVAAAPEAPQSPSPPAALPVEAPPTVASSAPGPAEQPQPPVARVQSYDGPDDSDDSDDEDGSDWWRYAAIAAFAVFAIVLWRVIARTGQR